MASAFTGIHIDIALYNEKYPSVKVTSYQQMPINIAHLQHDNYLDLYLNLYFAFSVFLAQFHFIILFSCVLFLLANAQKTNKAVKNNSISEKNYQK